MAHAGSPMITTTLIGDRLREFPLALPQAGSRSGAFLDADPAFGSRLASVGCLSFSLKLNATPGGTLIKHPAR
eukprot:12354428-Prorocentrum_lima.AAC.1